MRKFNTIKKSRKKSKDIDEKIEYLNKECQKTGLNEITMSTSGIYSVLGKEENPAHTTFTDASCNGQPFAMTSTNGLSIGGATTDENGFSFAPDGSGPATSYRGIASGFQPSKPGFQRSPEHRRIGSFLWYWNGSSYARLEWKFDNQNVSNAGQWAQWKQGAFTPFLDPIIGDASFDPDCLAAVLAAGGGGAFPDPDDITPPNNPVLFKNDLGDPSHLPINIDGMSPEAFNFLKNQATASSRVNYDVYNKLLDDHGIEAANWYENNPDLPGSSNPHVNPLIPLPLELVKNDSRFSKPVSDTEIPGPFAGAQDGDEIAFFGGDKPVDPTKKQNRATTQNIINYINSGGFMPLPKGWTKQQAQQFYNNYVNGTLSESLNEDVGIGHFEPEVLNVDINDIRKGIMPEFPKDPPPEMIGGYSAKSRLVRKDPQLPPFIKVTRKDLAKNHLLTDKQISEFLNDIKMINEYIKKNPAELMYAMIRYPKDDPRLAQLNFKMDEMKRASDRYVETHFPENISLFNKLQNKIRQNIEMTNPDNFTGHAEAPKFIETDISEQEKRRKTIIRHFKKKK